MLQGSPLGNMIHTFIPYTLCVFAMIVHHVSSDIEVRDKNGDFIRSFPSVVPIGNPYHEPLLGLIVLADPPDACEPIRKVNFCCNMKKFSKFVLIAGSTSPNCTIETKIENAANADFDLAILYGEKISSPNFTNICWVASSDDNTTSSQIHHNDGQVVKMEYLFQNNTKNFFYLTVFFETHFCYYMMFFGQILSVASSIFFILIMVCMCFLSLTERRQRSRSNMLPSHQINQFPTKKYTKGCPNDACAICLENYIEDEDLRVLPCSHAYHTHCVDPWLLRKRLDCPLCRTVHLHNANSRSYKDSGVMPATDSTPLVTPNVIDSSEPNDVIILPSTSVNAAYEDDNK